MENNKDQLEILRFLYKERKKIALAALLGGAIALAITSLMEPQYKSSATVFPPGFNSSERMLENPQFGYNIEADRLIQIGESYDLKDSLIDYFNLIEYYEIDQNDADWKSKLLKRYDRDISFERTKYMSVQISVINRDPDTAAAMVAEIIDLLSRFWERLFKNNMLQSLNYAQKMYVDKQVEVGNLLDSIHQLRSNNSSVSLDKLHKQLATKREELEGDLMELSKMRSSADFYDYGDKIDQLSEEMLLTTRMMKLEKAKIDGLNSGGKSNDSSLVMAQSKYEGAKEHMDDLVASLKKLNQLGERYEALNGRVQLEMDQYQQIKARYEQLLYAFEPLVESVDLDYLEARYVSERNVLNQLKEKFEKAHKYFNEPLPSLFVIESPRPVYKKYKPSYRINVGLSVLASVVAAIAFLLFGRSIRMIREGEDS